MAPRRKRIPNADVTPVVHKDLFASHPQCAFALAVTKKGLNADPVYTASLELRTRVYTAQTGMLDAAALVYGVDIDEDDYRAVTLAVVENRKPSPVVVACVRLIERTGSSDLPLPADALYGLNLDGAGVEVSRYICRLDNPDDQARALWEMLRSTIAHILQVGAESQVYAIVELPLERVLRGLGVGVTRVADPIWLDEYQGSNVAIKLDPIASAASLGGLAEIEALDVSEGAVRFWGTVDS